MRLQGTHKMKLYWVWVFAMISLALGLGSTSLKADGTWVRKADMPTPRSYSGAAVMDGIIYVIGGYNGHMVPDVEAYDPATDIWTKKADMPTPRSGLAVGAVNGKIYAIGGALTLDSGTSIVEEYDPKTDTWTRKADMPTRRDTLRSGVVDGIIYVVGGYAGGRSIPTVEAYDPATDTWTKKADMPTARWGIGDGLAVDGMIYIMSGQTAPSSSTKAVEVYDPATDTWTKKNDMPSWAGFHVGALDGIIFTVKPNVAASYDPTTETWTKEPGLPSNNNRYRFSIAGFNGKLYVIGGSLAWNGPGLATVDEFTPEGWPLQEAASVSSQSKLPALWGKLKVSR